MKTSAIVLFSILLVPQFYVYPFFNSSTEYAIKLGFRALMLGVIIIDIVLCSMLEPKWLRGCNPGAASNLKEHDFAIVVLCRVSSFLRCCKYCGADAQWSLCALAKCVILCPITIRK